MQSKVLKNLDPCAYPLKSAYTLFREVTSIDNNIAALFVPPKDWRARLMRRE